MMKNFKRLYIFSLLCFNLSNYAMQSTFLSLQRKSLTTANVMRLAQQARRSNLAELTSARDYTISSLTPQTNQPLIMTQTQRYKTLSSIMQRSTAKSSEPDHQEIYSSEDQEANRNNIWRRHKKTIGFTALGLATIGATLWGMESEYDDPEKMEDILRNADDQKKQEITEKVRNNFNYFVKNNKRMKSLKKIVEHSPDTAKVLTQPAAENLTALSDSFFGPYIVRNIMKHNPKAAKVFTLSITKKFSTLIKKPYFHEILHSIISRNPDAAKALTQLAAENFLIIVRRHSEIIHRIISLNPEAAKKISLVAAKNLTTFAEITDSHKIFYKLVKFNPKAIKAFILPAIENFGPLIRMRGGTLIIEKIMEMAPETAKVFTQPALENISYLEHKVFGHTLIDNIITLNPDSIKSFEAAAQKHHLTHLANIIERAKAKQEIIKLLNTNQTQTTQHFQALLEHNLNKMQHFFPTLAESIHDFKNMIYYIIEQEQIEQENSNYTFVHAYPWAIHFLQDIDASLRSIISNAPKQPISLRFIKPPKEETAQKHLDLRTTLLEQGSSHYYAHEGNLQKHMIFMNYALLTNQSGSNTLQYIARDRCENPRSFKLKKIFENFYIDHYHEKYAQEFEELQQLHDDANMFGAGILFSFTPEMLKQSVYVCYGGGKKRKVYIKGIGKTDDVQLIVDTLRTHPERIHDLDHLEFVFVVTKDCALNPRVRENDAYKVMPFNAADPEKLKLYEQKRNELMAKIKTDIEQERTYWTQEQQQEFNENQKEMEKWYNTYNCLNECESRVQEAS